MKRFIPGSLLVCLLVLTIGFLPVIKAGARTAQTSAVQAPSPSLSGLPQLKELVRKTLGQGAVDHMRQRVTQPLKIYASTQPVLAPKQASTATQSRIQANVEAPELYGNATTGAGYVTRVKSASWVYGSEATFNVPKVEGIVPVTTAVTVTNVDKNTQISLGVVTDAARRNASLSFTNGSTLDLFAVHSNDQIFALISLDTGANKWLIFIEDGTSGLFYDADFSYSTAFTSAMWLTTVNDSPFPPIGLITFTGAQWLSNWDGWQPILSPDSAYYLQWTLLAPTGGMMWPTEIPDPPGMGFTLISCSPCS